MIKRLLLSGALIAGAFVSWPRQAAAMGETAALTLDANVGQADSVVIDSSGTFAYVGTLDDPTGGGTVHKIRLSDFVVISTLTFPTTSQWGHVAVIDPQNNYAYFASASSPAVISKVNLSTFTVISSMTLPSGYEAVFSGVIDPAGTFAYFGTLTDPGMIAKVKLSDLTFAAGLILASGEDELSSATIDPVNNFAYFGAGTTPGKVIKIDLGTFTKTATLTLNSGSDLLLSAVLSTHTGMAYFGTSAIANSRIARVRLSDFTERPHLTLTTPGGLTSAVIDNSGTFAYFGSFNTPATITRIQLNTFTESAAVTLASGEDYVYYGAIDHQHDYAYFGLSLTPGVVVKFDLVDSRTGPPVIVTNPVSQTINLGGTLTFTVVPGGSSPFTYQWLKNGAAIGGATSASYTTPPLTFDDDGATYQCAVTNAFGTATSAPATTTVMPVITVFPQPWRSDRHSGTPLTFDGVAPNSTLKIYTLSMHWVKSIQGSDPITWDLTNDAGQRVASGYYFYIVTTQNERQNVRGKLAIIK